MAKKPKKSLPKIETEKINPVRKKVSHGKMRKIKLPKPLSSELSNGVKKTKIRVIGIGGGGGSIVSEIASRVAKASFAVANTDIKALKEASRKVIRFQFGENLTQGLGTGMNVGLGEIAAQNEKERIKKLLAGYDLIIIIASLGGGVGSGAGPVFAKISKSLGNLTYGIFTLPFKFEGEKKMEIAITSLKKIRPYLNTFSVIPNERIFQIIDKATPLKAALSAINKTLSESLEGLIETIYEPGLINIDFADLKTILSGRGRLCYLNTVVVPREENKSQEVIEKMLHSPLYPYTIRGAKGALFNIAGGKGINLSEVSQISKAISDLLNREAKIIFGISHTRPMGGKAKYQDKIKVTLLATGCGLKIGAQSMLGGQRVGWSPKKVRKQKKVKKKVIPEPTPQKLPKVKKAKKAKLKKAKTRVSKKPKEPERIAPAEVEEKKIEEKKGIEEKIRKSALQIKKEAEEAEKEMIEKEEFWETPAFLRRKFKVE